MKRHIILKSQQVNLKRKRQIRSLQKRQARNLQRNQRRKRNPKSHTEFIGLNTASATIEEILALPPEGIITVLSLQLKV